MKDLTEIEQVLNLTINKIREFNSSSNNDKRILLSESASYKKENVNKLMKILLSEGSTFILQLPGDTSICPTCGRAF